MPQLPIKRPGAFQRLRLKFPRRFRSKRGIALIIALSIMALLVLLGTAFSLSAIYASQGAQLANQIIKTRLLMESATQEALATVTLTFNDPNNVENMMPATKAGQGNRFGLTTESSAWDGRYYWTSMGDDQAGLADAFAHSIAGYNITPAGTYDLLSSDTPGWVHIKDSEGSSAITGRYAYLIIDESGQLDVNAVISTEDASAEGTEAGTRIGKDAKELNLRHVTSAALAESFQYVGIDDGSSNNGGGQLKAGLTWLSRHYMLSVNTVAKSLANAYPNTKTFHNPGIFHHSQEIEAFFDVTDFHRYNLAHTRWDTFNNSVASSGLAADASEFFANGGSVAANVGGIPWLSGGSTQEDQILANLIDFSDSDSIATTDDASNPTYVGLEKVPYLNELMVYVDVTDLTAVDYVRVGARVELANIYDENLGNGSTITMTFDYATNQGVSDTGATITWNLGSNVTARTYEMTNWRSWSKISEGVTELTDVKLTNITLSMKDGDGNLLDFAHLPDQTTGATIPATTTPNVTSFEVNDPRHNTPASQWTWQGWGSAGTATERNLACVAPVPTSGEFDLEDTNYMGETTFDDDTLDDIHLSTAYIRNAPINSLWQLGCIHRGSAWQTLNINAYNSVAPAEGLDNRNKFGTYTQGDANLLDQVKLSNKTYVTGLVNINTYNQNVIRALIADLHLSGDLSDPNPADEVDYVAVTTANADAIAGTPGSLAAGDWLYQNGSEADTDKPFFTRAELATVTGLSAFNFDGDDGTVDLNTDAKQEEMIGKIANLCSTRSNYFTMILVSQTVRDLPTGYLGGTRGIFDEGVDTIIAEQFTRVLLKRDAYSNQLESLRYDVFID